jgi:hypothetical protein
MSRSLIQTASQSSLALEAGAVIPLGSVIRRYGCNCRLNGNSVEIEGEGYYEIDGTITLQPTEAGNVSVALYENGVVIPGTTVTGTVAAISDSITLPIVGTIRESCCANPAQLTIVLTENGSSGSSVSLRVKRS